MANVSDVSALFVKATQKKFRFPYQGEILTEDLWDLSQAQLDKVYQTLGKQVKKASEDSLLDCKTAEDKILSDKMEIVKYVFKSKQEAAEKAAKAQATRAKNQRIADIIASKEDQALQNMSVEQLKAMLAQEDVED